MGANAKMILPDSVDRGRLLKESAEVPIDCDVLDNGEVEFHYAYWNEAHGRKCEAFVSGIAIGAGIQPAKWGY